jgi:hypothetical protein
MPRHESGLTCIHAAEGLCPACAADYDADPTAWVEYGDRCPACRGTGHIEGVAAALFRAAPITDVRLSDCRPVRLTWWNLPLIGTEHPDHIGPLFAHLPPARREHRFWKMYESEAAALSALSAACVKFGRARAGRSALARPGRPTPHPPS